MRAEAVITADGEEVRCVAARTPTTLACTADGVTWEQWFRGEGDRVRSLVSWPEGGNGRVLLLDDLGLWTSDDGGTTWADRAPWGTDLFVEMARTSDGTLVASSRSGRVGRSTDGGDTWEDLGLLLPGFAYDIVPRPDWAAHDDVLFATHDGAWVVRGAAGASPTLSRWMDVQRIDDWSEYIQCDGCSTPLADPEADMGSIQPVDPGVRLTARVRGVAVQVFGRSDGASSGQLSIDGTVRATFGDTVVDGLLARVDGLDAGEHEVTIEGLAGSGLLFDALEGVGTAPPIEMDGVPADDTGTGETGTGNDTGTGTGDSAADSEDVHDSTEGVRASRCGCAAGGSPAVLGALPALAFLLARRRRLPG
jgi:hypothetical protein